MPPYVARNLDLVWQPDDLSATSLPLALWDGDRVVYLLTPAFLARCTTSVGDMPQSPAKEMARNRLRDVLEAFDSENGPGAAQAVLDAWIASGTQQTASPLPDPPISAEDLAGALIATAAWGWGYGLEWDATRAPASGDWIDLRGTGGPAAADS